MARTAQPLFIAFIAAALTALLAAGALAQSLVLNNLVVDNQAGTFTARFGVGVDGVEHVRDALQEGAVLGLNCEAALYQSKSYLPNKLVRDTTWVSVVRYDPLKKEYVLEVPGRDAARNQRLGQLLAGGWESVNIDLGPWESLERGHQYSLELTISLGRIDTPNWLKRTLFFWSGDVVDPATYQLDFRY